MRATDISKEGARLVERYNLGAVPVVGADDRIRRLLEQALEQSGEKAALIGAVAGDMVKPSGANTP